MKSADLAPLADLAAMVDEAAQAALAAEMARMRRVEAELGALAQGMQDRGSLGEPGSLAAQERYRRWMAVRRADLLVKMAEVRSAVEAARLAAQKAHGRCTALQDLLADARQDERLRREQRRSDPGAM
jgi:hypothetical protein